MVRAAQEMKVRPLDGRSTSKSRLPVDATHLRRVRLSKGMTLEQVADKAGVNAGYLSKCERGLRRLSVDSLLVVAAALGLGDVVAALAPFASRTRRREGREGRSRVA